MPSKILQALFLIALIFSSTGFSYALAQKVEATPHSKIRNGVPVSNGDTKSIGSSVWGASNKAIPKTNTTGRLSRWQLYAKGEK